jgi:hypothetical protein
VPRPDVPSLVAGLAIVAFGTVLLLDQVGSLDLGFAALGPIACAVLGGILLATGLNRGD